MAIIQEPNAVFYHPLDDATEALQAQPWDGNGGFRPAKVSLGMEDQPEIGAFGALTKFQGSAPGISFVSTARMGPTTFVVAYRDDSDSGSGQARVGTVSGTDVTYGAEFEFSAASPTSNIAVAALDATKFVVAYENVLTNEVRVGTVTGVSIAYGTVTVYSANAMFSPTFAVALDPAKFVVVWSNTSGRGTSKVGTVSGTDIVFSGAEVDFLASGAPDDIGAVALSASKFVVAYWDGGDSGHGTAKVGTVSGTDITFGAESEYVSAGSAIENCVVALSPTKFVVAYADFADDGHLTARVGLVSGTDITFGAETEFVSTAATPPDLGISAAALRATQFVVAYTNIAANAERSRVGTVTGTDIAFGAEAEFMTGAKTDTLSAVALSPFKFAVAYADESSSAHGTVKANDMAQGASLALPIGFGGLTESEYFSASAFTSTPIVSALSATAVVAVYRNPAAFLRFTVRIGAVSGADITWGTPVEATGESATSPDNLGIGVMTPTKFVLAHRNRPSSDEGVAKVGVVSGTDVTFGADVVFNSPGNTEHVSVLGLNAGQCVVAYRDGNDSNRGKAKIGTVSGTIILFGAETLFGGGVGIGAGTSMSALSSTQFVLSYSSSPDADKGSVKVGTVSGSLMTFGARASYGDFGGNVTTLSATKIAVAWGSPGNNEAAVGMVSGTDVTFGAAAKFIATGTVFDIRIATLDASRFAVVWWDTTDSNRAAVRVGTVSGTTVAFPDPDLQIGAGHETSIAALSATDFVVSFADGDDGNHGTALVGTHRPDPHPTAVGATRLAFSSWTQA